MTTTVQENRLKFETFKKKRNKNFAPLPKWFTEQEFKKVLEFINAGLRLQAVKHVHSLAKAKNTEMLLKVAKEEYLDEIELIGGKIAIQPIHAAPPAPQIPTPTHSALNNLLHNLEAGKNKPITLNVIQKNDVLRALEPFARMAKLYNDVHKNMSGNEIVSAYRYGQLTLQDFRNIETLVKRLSQ